jgi:hypothetical protein
MLLVRTTQVRTRFFYIRWNGESIGSVATISQQSMGQEKRPGDRERGRRRHEGATLGRWSGLRRLLRTVPSRSRRVNRGGKRFGAHPSPGHVTQGSHEVGRVQGQYLGVPVVFPQTPLSSLPLHAVSFVALSSWPVVLLPRRPPSVARPCLRPRRRSPTRYRRPSHPPGACPPPGLSLTPQKDPDRHAAEPTDAGESAVAVGCPGWFNTVGVARYSYSCNAWWAASV